MALLLRGTLYEEHPRARLHEELGAAGVEFKIVEAHGPVRDVLRAEGLEERVGSISRLASLAELLDAGSTSVYQDEASPPK